MSGKEKKRSSGKSKRSSGKGSNKSKDSDNEKNQRYGDKNVINLKPECLNEYNIDCISLLQKPEK